jgi:RNA polymerase sigma-70 factor (ECF subfamily)
MAAEDAPSRLDAISTRWTLLQKAGGEGGVSVDNARNALVLRYLGVVRRYVGAMVRNQQDAEDVTQDVLVRFLAGDFAGADPGRGRFRDFLKTAIRNMVRNYWDRQERRRTADLDVALVAAEKSDEDDWLVQWRQNLLELVWKALEKSEEEQPGSDVYTVLRLRTDHPDDSSEQLAQRLSGKLGKAIRPDATRQKLRRARMRFVDLLLVEVARGLNDPTPEKIDDELVALGLADLVHSLLPHAV